MRKAAVAAATCAILIVSGAQDATPEGATAAIPPMSRPSSLEPPTRTTGIVLQRGDRGLLVAALQVGLTHAGWPTVVDGIFGRHTERTVRGFQRANGLDVDGVAGPRTIATLTRAVGTPTTPTFPNDCAEMSWYRQQAGLPPVFDQLGWRESNCRNEDAVRTWCCYGWWQLYFNLHWSDPRMRPKMIACGVDSPDDYNSDNPDDKRRQACVAKALYDTVGIGAWSL